jgi:hypothetical protein
MSDNRVRVNWDSPSGGVVCVDARGSVQLREGMTYGIWSYGENTLCVNNAGKRMRYGAWRFENDPQGDVLAIGEAPCR